MIETYNKLTLYVLTDKQAESRDFGYKYIVYNNWSNHTAFKTLQGLKYWAKIRNLTLPEVIEEGASQSIIGEYIRYSLLHIDPILPDYSNVQSVKNWDAGSFNQFGESNNLQKGYIMDNGDYTTCYIFKGRKVNNEYGQVNPKDIIESTILYYLNPNCKRDIYNWRNFSDGIPLDQPELFTK